jgi:hypothetical protein
MVALKRFAVFVSLSVGLWVGTASGAQLSLGLPPGRYVSSAEPLTIAVTLQALAVTDSEYIRSSWLDELNLRAFDDNGGEVPIRVVARRPRPRTVVSSKVPRNGVREDGIVLHAEFDIVGIPEERTRIRVEYQDLKNEITLIPKGGRTEEPHLTASEEGGKEVRTYAEYRIDAMRRLEESPYNWVILWDLAESAIAFGTQEEAEEYLRKALETQAAYIEFQKNSKDPLQRAGRQSVEKELRKNKAMAGAILSLLPEYFVMDRGKTQLVIDGMMGQVVLKDRETYEVIKTVRASAFAERAPEHDAP